MNPTPWLVPESTEILQLHTLLGVHVQGPPKPGCVESAMGAALSACVYAVEDPRDADLFCLSAHALTYLAINQCFPDGNKRIAWSVFVRIFDLNGMRLIADEVEAAALTKEVAEKLRGAAEVMNWLAFSGRVVPS